MTTLGVISGVFQRRIPCLREAFSLSFGPGYFGPIPLALLFLSGSGLSARALRLCTAGSGANGIRDRLPGRARRGGPRRHAAPAPAESAG